MTAGSAASLPPAGLPGLDPRFSRLVEVPESGSDRSNTWHVLDNLELIDGEPLGTILCVHGNPTWSFLWRRLVAVSGRWRVLAVDQLEMGFSERTGTHRPLTRRVRDLGDLTDALGLAGPVVTFGHDWGGVVSLGWAIDHPQLLDRVMLLNTAVHQQEGKPIPAPLRLARLRGMLGAATVATPAFLETTLSLAHPPLADDVKAAYRAPYRSAGRRGGIGSFVADIPVNRKHESWAELDRIAAGVAGLEVPALMLWGPRDPIFGDQYLNDLVKRMPQADVHRYEGAGHLIAEEVDYAHAALSWLAESSGLSAVELKASAKRLRDPSADRAGEVGPAPARIETSELEVGFDTRAPSSRATQPAALWHNLEQFSDSDDTALVEMAPPSGPAPRVVSWKLLSRRVRQLAAGLTRAGVEKGDRVSLLVPPGADLTAVLYACLRIGAIVVVADAGLGLRGLTRAVRGTWPDHVIGALPGLTVARALGWPGQKISTTQLALPARAALGVTHSLPGLAKLGLDELLPGAPDASDTAAVLFTSGSTGPAKGVVYTHAQLSAVRDALASQYDIGPGTGLVAGFAPFALLGPALGTRSASPQMDVSSPKTLTAVAVARAAQAVDATVVFLSPAALANVVATAGDLDDDGRAALARVRTFLSAGAPVSEPLLAAASALMPFASAHTPYGMTEGLLMTDISLEGIRAASASAAGAGGVCVGVPGSTTRVRISALDENGEAVGAPASAPDVTGEILVSAPHVKNNYHRLWNTDLAARRDAPHDERWHRTGDVGHLDSQGRLWVEGRLPHVLVTAGGVVTPVGPEQRIESVPPVARAALIGVGPRGTHQLVAVVELRAGARRVALAAPELSAKVRAAAGHPIAAVLVVPHLPTDLRHNSKIDRTRLGKWAAGILSGGRMVRP